MLNNETYYKDTEYLSRSQFHDWLHCNYLYQQKYLNKTVKQDTELTKAIIIGKGVDVKLTDDSQFDQQFYLGTTKDELKFENQGKTRLTTTLVDTISKCVSELHRQPLYKSMFGDWQKQVILTNEIGGVKIKGKLDLYHPDKGIADIKTTADLERDRWNWGNYAFQLAFYSILSGKDLPCYLIIVDKNQISHSVIQQLSVDKIEDKKQFIFEMLPVFRDRNNLYPPVVQRTGLDPEHMRQKYCFKCPHYADCKYSLQQNINLITWPSTNAIKEATE